MKRRNLIPKAVALLLCIQLHAQTGYIYVHLKNINEQSSGDYSFTVKNSAGVAINTFSLNDGETADNSSTSSNYLYVYDIGVSHGSGGDGQLWAIAGTSYQTPGSAGANGTVYTRPAGSSNWSSTSITAAIAIDGAYQNQFVYVTVGGNVVFYNNGVTATIYTGGNATDVTANGGNIAIVAGGVIYLYSNSYSAGNAPATGGTWGSVLAVNAGARLDLNLAGTVIAFILGGTNTVKTVPCALASTPTALTTPGIGATVSGYVDIAYDDNGTIYATANASAGTDIIYSYNGTSWAAETQSRQVARITGGDAKCVYGIPCNYGGSQSSECIWDRECDNNGNIYWIDDDRVKLSVTLNGNGICIPVAPGTYTVTVSLPGGCSLIRCNLYDPGGNSSCSILTRTITCIVVSGEIVFGECVCEKLNVKTIALNCNTQYLQTFDATISVPLLTYIFGGGTYGATVEGTAYHYWGDTTQPAYTPCGYYMVEKTGIGWANSLLADHTGNGGYFLVVSAAFAQDEFYRQRLTNLVPGLTYTISFYAANMAYTSALCPNVLFGVADTLGNTLAVKATGTFSTDALWHNYTLTFTATASVADLFLRNNTTGGQGNVLALDDICINPVAVTLGTNTYTSTSSTVCTANTYTFSNTISGGLWASANIGILKIDVKTGIALTIKAGVTIVTYTYANQIGCISTTSTTLTVAAPAVVTVSDKLNGSFCLGQADSLYLNVSSGSVAPYTYSWVSNPSAGCGLASVNLQSTVASATIGGSYMVTGAVTDANGCTASGSITLAVSAHIAPNVSILGSNICLGSALSSLKAAVTGGSGSYTYLWAAVGITTSGLNLINSLLQNPNPIPTLSGAYNFSLSVNDGYCTVSALKSLTVYASPSLAVASAPAGSITLCLNGSVALSPTVSGGTAPYNYLWSCRQGSSGGLSATTVENVAAAPTVALTNPGYTYILLITDANGCTATDSVTDKISINAFASAPAVTASASPLTVCAGSTVNLSANVNVGLGLGYAYTWTGPPTITNGTGLGVGVGGIQILSASGGASAFTSGNYTLTVTDVLTGCVAAAVTPTVTINAAPSVTVHASLPTLCNNTSDSIYATASGGTGPISYQWGSVPNLGILFNLGLHVPGTGITLSAAGLYKLYVLATDANGCTSLAGLSDTTTISVINSSGPLIAGLNTSITACVGSTIALDPIITGGNFPFDYKWVCNNTGSGLDSSNYTTQNLSLVPTIAGKYVFNLNVTDLLGCEVIATSDTVNINAAVGVTATAATPVFCGSTGTVQLLASPTGGCGSYKSCLWIPTVLVSPGTALLNLTSLFNPVASISGAATGSSFQYTAIVTDSTGCIGTGITTPMLVVGPPVISVGATPSSNCTSGTSNILTSLSGVLSGGTLPYSYEWTPPSHCSVSPSSGTTSSSTVSATAYDSSAQNYSFGLLALDANNCLVSGLSNLFAINLNPTVNLAANVNTACANPATTINLTSALTATTTPPYTYAWTGSGVANNTGSGSTTAVPTASGIYNVSVTDANGCVATAASVNISLDLATPSISVICATGSVQLFETNGTSWYWSTTSGGEFYTGSDYSALTDSATSHLEAPFINYMGNYTVQITDPLGCIGTGGYIVGPCGTLLALNLLSLNAQRKGDIVALQWKVASEAATRNYIIERSTDGENFAPVGTVVALNTGSKTYNFNDDVSSVGCVMLYYRIKQTDENGSFYYSKTVMVNCDGNDVSQYVLKVYPNPVQSQTNLTVAFTMPEQVSEAAVVITDVLGKQYYQGIIGNQPQGVNTITVPVTGKMAAGTYFLRIVSDKWLSKTVKIIKL